jgi:hypothetical protein
MCHRKLFQGPALKLLSSSAPGRSKCVLSLTALVVIAIVVSTYWPVLRAQFVWTDIPNFQQSSWIRYGDDWLHFIFNGFNSWTNYFRPLVVALFTLEVRSFDAQPGPMHAVSLFLHALNTLLVGALAVSLSGDRYPPAKRWQLVAIPMLLYGLHPLLVESVTWIGCQFDLVATFFVLLAILLNNRIRHRWLRAATVAFCFFLGACAKESAAPLLFLLVVLDWLAFKPGPGTPIRNQAWSILKRNWPVYVFTLMAGIAYLLVRHSAMGTLAVAGGGDHLSPWARVQVVCFLYMRYWQLFFWPTAGMGPMHVVAMQPFFTFSADLLLCDLAALGIVLTGIWLVLRRIYLGGMIMAVTFALMPVLHIVAAYLDTSLYHERYAMTPLALACSLLPLVLLQLPIPKDSLRTASSAGYVGVVVWLMLSITSIRQTVPLWSFQVPLWQWAVQENPGFIGAKDELISAYVGNGDNAKAWQLINSIVAENVPCTACMLNGAMLALNQRNTKLATFFIDRLERPNGLADADPTTFVLYLKLKAELLLLQKKPATAEKALHKAIEVGGPDPDVQMDLAVTLALEGKTAEAKEVEQAALMLMPPEERAKRHQLFLAILASPGAASGAH